MPHKSKAQQGYFHANEKKIGKAVVKEFDDSANFGTLPKRTASYHREKMHEHLAKANKHGKKMKALTKGR